MCVWECFVFVFFFLRFTYSNYAHTLIVARTHTAHTHFYSIYWLNRYTSLSIFLESTLSLLGWYLLLCFRCCCCCWCCFLVVEIELSYRVERSVGWVVFSVFSCILLYAFTLSPFCRMRNVCVCEWVSLFFFISNLQQHCCITFSFTSTVTRLYSRSLFLLLLLMFVCLVRMPHNS